MVSEAQPQQSPEIYLTGISGSFPDSHSVKHLQENLFNKVDLISDDDRRWKVNNPEVPPRAGKIYNIEKFDASFFGIPSKEAHTMDPSFRIILEKTYEAIIDAGFNPAELRGTRTGVFMGFCLSESESALFYDHFNILDNGVEGCIHSMIATNVSRWLGVEGPSYMVDTACSSSAYALEHAYRALAEGRCDAAIVGGANLCMHPISTQQFFRMGVLSADGTCKTFDDSANGYVRSESIVACLLQKAPSARRAYAQLVHAKTNCDGYKEQGISYPSGKTQELLLCEFYKELGLSPTVLEFVEAHGTGTKAGDPEEGNAIDRVFCTGRKEPLLIGSIKSNLGHTESSSGLCSVSKLMIAYNTGYIPPNLHYHTPRRDVPGLVEGRLRVVTDKQPWGRGYSAFSSFGFGGANAHILFKNVARDKVNKGLPSDDLPRLVCVSGRTPEAVAKILDDLESHTVDVDEVRLWHAIHERDIAGHEFRGYTLLASTSATAISLTRDIQELPCEKRPIYFVFSSLNPIWLDALRDLMRLPIFANALERYHNELKSTEIDLQKILSSNSRAASDAVTSSVGVTAVQLGLVDVMTSLGVQPDFIIGHGIGELAAAYAAGGLTAAQALQAAAALATALADSQPTLPVHKVCAHYNQVKPLYPENINIAYGAEIGCCTISGPKDAIAEIMNTIQDKKITTEKATGYDLYNHPKRLTDTVQTKLLATLKKIIPDPKPISNILLKSTLQKHSVQKLSAEYIVDSFLNPASCRGTPALLESETVVVDILSQGLVDDKHAAPAIVIQLTEKGRDDYVNVLLRGLGLMYLTGANPKLSDIYPAVAFPVAQGTPMLAHLVEWEHREDWFIVPFNNKEQSTLTERTVTVSVQEDEFDYLSGHVIDGRLLYPATGYLILAWETFGIIEGRQFTDVSVVFEDIVLHRATYLPKEGKIEFTIMFHKASGKFEITEGETTVVTGRIRKEDDVSKNFRYVELPPPLQGTDAIPMSSKDFYKELSLRGYQYKGLFRGVLQCAVDSSRGRLRWDNNWITFLDTLLQAKIVSQDTRSLYVPTRIEKISIDVNLHTQIVTKLGLKSTNISLEFQSFPDLEMTRCGGVELRGSHVTAITKKLPLGIPVLEENIFVENFPKDKVKVEDALRVDIQLIMENIQTYKFKSLEVVDDEYEKNKFEPVIEKIADILADMPLVQAELTVLSEQEIQMPPNIVVEKKKVSSESNAVICVGANLLSRHQVLRDCLTSLRSKSFVISRESSDPSTKEIPTFIDIVTTYNTGSEYLVMLRNKIQSKPAKYINITILDETFSWIEEVKTGINDGQKVVLYTENEEVNGLLGLVNCLRKEAGGNDVYGILINDSTAPKFDPNIPFYAKQLCKDLALNVLQNGKWGTYRHLLMNDLDTVTAPHAYVNTTVYGDLNSLSWLEGPIKHNELIKDPSRTIVQVYCSSLNFRDVMTAMGRVTLDAVARGRLAQDCVQGIEVAGRTANGSRVMAICQKGISNVIECDKSMVWSIPDEWSFEEAATIPVAYSTVYMAMAMIGRMKRGESILVHAGSGGVGQAAINVALHHGLRVYTTVGTPAKRAFIKKLFPQLKDNHIGNSRDLSFEAMIRRETKGRGVDMVLNSLSDEKLQASLRCLSRRGRFLEIGKYDITNNAPVRMHMFRNEISVHGVMLDFIDDPDSVALRDTVKSLVTEGISSGAVRPLTYCTFERTKIEAAYRYMAAGKHIGKVVIKIRSEEPNKYATPNWKFIDAIPRYTCSAEGVYVIVGGLGGFGLELADWLVLRGARRLLLGSRAGLRRGYAAYRTRIWKSYGVDVRISTHDVATEIGCTEMLNMASSMGPVQAIFNLAVVLKDAIFQNQTPETFIASFKPKALATIHLDEISRKLCPNLREFVIFSSVSCGRGNAGQANYGYSNSVMERVCERRRAAGLPALALQWGAIGDVGLVADMQEDNIQLEIGGTLQQRISSCLDVMDKFLKQDATIVSSIVVAEKKTLGSGSGNIAESIANIMGITDLKTVSPQMPLAEMGMDSITAVEIKQTLERQYEIFLTAQEIRTLTFARLAELAAVTDSPGAGGAGGVGEGAGREGAPRPGFGAGLQLLMKNIGDERLAYQPCLDLPSLVNEQGGGGAGAAVFLLAGVEGCGASLGALCARLRARTRALQLPLERPPARVPHMADVLLQKVKSCLRPGAPFVLVGYSFGSLPMLSLTAKLENEGHRGVLICVDGSPAFIKALAQQHLGEHDDFVLQNTLICYIASVMAPGVDTAALMQQLQTIPSYDERVKFASQILPKGVQYSEKFLADLALASFNRIKAVQEFDTKTVKKFKSPIVLIRPKLLPNSIECEDNYKLDMFTESTVRVHRLDADHMNIADLEETADIVNNVLLELDNPPSDKSNISVMNIVEESKRPEVSI